MENLRRRLQQAEQQLGEWWSWWSWRQSLESTVLPHQQVEQNVDVFVQKAQEEIAHVPHSLPQDCITQQHVEQLIGNEDIVAIEDLRLELMSEVEDEQEQEQEFAAQRGIDCPVDAAPCKTLKEHEDLEESAGLGPD